MSISTAFPSSPQTSSAQLVQAGVTQLQGDSVGGVQSVAQTVSAINGWQISETTGSAGAKVRLWDGIGTGAGNYLRAVIDIGSNGQSNEEPQSPIQIVNGGIYLQVVSGSVDGSIQWSE